MPTDLEHVDEVASRFMLVRDDRTDETVSWSWREGGGVSVTVAAPAAYREGDPIVVMAVDHEYHEVIVNTAVDGRWSLSRTLDTIPKVSGMWCSAPIYEDHFATSLCRRPAGQVEGAPAGVAWCRAHAADPDVSVVTWRGTTTLVNREVHDPHAERDVDADFVASIADGTATITDR